MSRLAVIKIHENRLDSEIITIIICLVSAMLDDCFEALQADSF